MNKEMSGTTRMILCGLAIAINIVLGIITSALKWPLYLDTIGTVFIAVYFGPWYGAAVGGLTNILTSIISGSMSGVPFMLVSIAIGLIVGFVYRKFKFSLMSAIVLGLIISVVAPLIGTPIGIAVYGGLTGTISDVAVLWLKQSGASIFTASFIPKVFNNLIDKVGTFVILFVVIKALPWKLKPKCSVK